MLVLDGPVAQSARTLDDAMVIFEVLSDDTAATERAEKLIDDEAVPSLRWYVMLEQASRAAILCRRAPERSWAVSALTEGEIALPDLGRSLPFDEIYRGLAFPEVDGGVAK